MVWVNKDSKIQFNQREDLINLKGITVINNSFGQEFDNFAKEKLSIETVPSLTQAFRMMKLGRVDYLLYEESPARAYTQRLRIEDETHTIGSAISSEGMFLTLSHRSPCNTPALRGKLTKALHELLAAKREEEALHNGLLKWRNQPGLN